MALEIPAIREHVHTSPSCGASNATIASAEARAARIRLAIASDWVGGPRPQGPDGRRLLACLTLWITVMGCAWAARGDLFGLWGSGASLVIVAALGVWADRRAARKRGWIDPMARAEQIVREVRARAAATSTEPCPEPNVATCDDCGHGSDQAAQEIESTASA